MERCARGNGCARRRRRVCRTWAPRSTRASRGSSCRSFERVSRRRRGACARERCRRSRNEGRRRSANANRPRRSDNHESPFGDGSVRVRSTLGARRRGRVRAANACVRGLLWRTPLLRGGSRRGLAKRRRGRRRPKTSGFAFGAAFSFSLRGEREETLGHRPSIDFLVLHTPTAYVSSMQKFEVATDAVLLKLAGIGRCAPQIGASRR